jgi:hypothetical protein
MTWGENFGAATALGVDGRCKGIHLWRGVVQSSGDDMDTEYVPWQYTTGFTSVNTLPTEFRYRDGSQRLIEECGAYFRHLIASGRLGDYPSYSSALSPLRRVVPVHSGLVSRGNWPFSCA